MFLENSKNAHSQQNFMASQMKQLHSELKKMIAIGQPLKEKSRKCAHILESLQYNRMTGRRERILEAHANTFQWIFAESPLSQYAEHHHHFFQWLEDGNGLFWISGKAGSGKSTLMKYITEHPKTRRALRRWSSNRQLITASFYFWHAGTTLQKSQEGLLRSLLYEILSQCPDRIPEVLPAPWELCEQPNPTYCRYTRAELVNALAKFSSQPVMLNSICIFIDGLDEYDGDHRELIRLLQGFSRPNNIKICASSRPWNVFETAFGGGSLPMLRLQDLTRNDITIYVCETLEQNNLFNQPRKRDHAHCAELVEEVVSKAQGVFLWVMLVVRSLIIGLTNADRVTELRRRLRLLPADLESLFSHMLATTDTFYEKQTAQTFEIALHASKPQNIMTYVMLDELDEDPQFALHLDIREWQSTEIRSKIESMVLRINARGMGLLEVVRNQDSAVLGGDEVDFLHRTVRDFFRLRAIEDWIAHRLPLRFNIDQLLCNAILAQVKTINVNLARDPGKLLCLVHDMMQYAYNLETNLETAPTILLDSLSQAISQHIRAYSEGELENDDTKCNIMLKFFHGIKRPDVGPASKKIILQVIRTFLQHGASLDNVLHRSESSSSQGPEKDHVPEHPLWVWNMIAALWQDPYFSREEKAELRAMFPSSMNPTTLPFRPYPTPGQILDNPERSLKRKVSDFDSAVTVSPNQTTFKRRFDCTTAAVIDDTACTVGSWYDYDERPPTPFPSLDTDLD